MLGRRLLFVLLASVWILSSASVGFTRVEKPAADPSFQGMQWRNLGPFRGGRSNASTGVPQQPGVFYFGGVGSGVWKTTDSGENWKNVSDATFGTSSVGAITVAPSDPNVVYVGMGEHAIRGVMTSHGDGVYRSNDAGATWAHLGLDTTRHISAVVVNPRDEDLVYVAAQGAAYGRSADRGIYRSRDGGATWNKVLFVSESAGASSLSMDPSNPRVLYAAFWDHIRLPWQVRSGGPGSSVWKSTDSGDTWKRLGELKEGGFPVTRGKISVSAAPDSRRVFALIEADPGGGLYRSEDGGESWTMVNDDWGLRARAWYYIKVYADPTNTDVVWITNARTYKSIDGGKSFATVDTPHGDNHHLWINPQDPNVMINSNDGGANVSHNGGASWSTQRNQPTGQFYRVNVDHQVPYHVYGGQQDNSAVGIVSAVPGGIGWGDFYSVAGCESSTPTFDRDDPEYVYGGCYMGIVEEWRRSTRRTRDVMVVPWMPAALPAREMKYRFNWNAPMAASPFDPSVIYHGANVILRTRDRGVTWQEVSPDLTRNEDEKQGPGGGPITNEGAGGEIYNTIYSMALSPHERGTMWAGSDDGRLHITRDDGANWSEVTPKGIGEAIINAIEVSPHEAGKAFIAVTRYKFNDFEPMAFATKDYGRNWRRIASTGNGIAANHWVRVVREDPVRPGLLYLGAENGLYVSFDDGGWWQSLALNLPVTPITDLIVQGPSNDLVASTAGRGFWVLDDLSPLQQHNEIAEAKGSGPSSHLFRPEPAFRSGVAGGGGSDSSGANPPGVATIDFVVKGLEEDQELGLEIVSSDGEVVRTFLAERKLKGVEREIATAVPETTEVTTDEPSAVEGMEDMSDPDSGSTGSPGSPGSTGGKDETKDVFAQAQEATVTKFELKEGMMRVPWDGRHSSVRPVPGLYVFGSLRGRKAVPGTYTARLIVRDAEGSEVFALEQPLRLSADLYEIQDIAAYREQDSLIRRVETELEEMHNDVLRLRKSREQVADLQTRIRNRPDPNEDLLETTKKLVADIDAVLEELVQKRTVDGQTVINFPTKLNQHFIFLRSALDDSDGIVNQAGRDRAAALSEQWRAIDVRVEELLGARVADLNAKVRDSGFDILHAW